MMPKLQEQEIDNATLTFGKYRGKTPEEIGDIDPSYIVWLHGVRPDVCSKELADSCEADLREADEEAYRDWFDDWVRK